VGVWFAARLVPALVAGANRGALETAFSRGFAEGVEKIRYLMRKWVDRCWKSGMVPNPPRIAAMFFESLVPSQDEVSGVQMPRETSLDRNDFDSGKAKIELCVIRQDIWVNTKVNLTGLDRRKPVRP